MNTLLDISKYYYYFICILWPFLIFFIVKNRLFFNSKLRKTVFLNKAIAIGLLSVLLFYSCLPISLFYFDRFEHSASGAKLSSIWGFSLYKTNSVDFKYRVDSYALSTRTGRSTRRQRIVIELDQKCYYSHILAYQSGVQKFVSFFSTRNQQENICRRAEDVERDIVTLRAVIAFSVTISGILAHRFLI